MSPDPLEDCFRQQKQDAAESVNLTPGSQQELARLNHVFDFWARLHSFNSNALQDDPATREQFITALFELGSVIIDEGLVARVPCPPIAGPAERLYAVRLLRFAIEDQRDEAQNLFAQGIRLPVGMGMLNVLRKDLVCEVLGVLPDPELFDLSTTGDCAFKCENPQTLCDVEAESQKPEVAPRDIRKPRDQQEDQPKDGP